MTTVATPFSCQRGSLTIRGEEIHREGLEGPAKTVIISHGFTSNMTKTKPYGMALAEAGFRCFVYDFCGGGLESASDGSFTDMTPLTEVDDLLAVVEYVRSRDDTDNGQITLAGCSQGGFVSGLVSAKLKEQIRSLILLYPALCIPDDARKGSMQFFRFDPQNVPDVIEAGPFKLGGCYPISVMDMDQDQEISAYDGPVLIIHGDSDEFVDVKYAYQLFDYLISHGHDDCELHILEGAPHGFRDEYFDTALELMLSFLETN